MVDKKQQAIPSIAGAGEAELQKAAIEFLYIFGITKLPRSEVPFLLNEAIDWLNTSLGGGHLQEVIKRVIDAHQTAGSKK